MHTIAADLLVALQTMVPGSPVLCAVQGAPGHKDHLVLTPSTIPQQGVILFACLKSAGYVFPNNISAVKHKGY